MVQMCNNIIYCKKLSKQSNKVNLTYATSRVGSVSIIYCTINRTQKKSNYYQLILKLFLKYTKIVKQYSNTFPKTYNMQPSNMRKCRLGKKMFVIVCFECNPVSHCTTGQYKPWG